MTTKVVIVLSRKLLKLKSGAYPCFYLPVSKSKSSLSGMSVSEKLMLYA